MREKAAEKELGHTILVTPHVLRHTFACFFIEAVISARATEDGADPAQLNQQQIESYGAESLTILKELLGHAWIKDTTRYLRQLSMSRVGLRYLEIFTSAMEEVLDDAPRASRLGSFSKKWRSIDLNSYFAAAWRLFDLCRGASRLVKLSRKGPPYHDCVFIR